MIDIHNIGKRMKKSRNNANLTQEQLAEKVNISTNYLSSIERGDKIPRLETFVKIANALNVSADELLMDVIRKDRAVKYTQLCETLLTLTVEESQLINTIIEAIVGEFNRKKK